MAIVIKKDGSFVSVHATEELYTCCKYKTNKDFIKLHEWDKYELWGKSKGKSGSENKCELPAPIENVLFFGMLCVRKKDGDLTLDEWTTWYNEKMGSSIKLESEEESVDSEHSESEYTKEGYLKDDFVVDELIEESYD
jgi:alpha-L-arabinofuranosidase